MIQADTFIQDLARKAGKILKGRFGRVHTVRMKAHSTDVVTEADISANELIVSAIRKRFPSHGIISEETGTHQDGADYLWYIDPLDGTYNFSKNTPIFCTMIGLAYKGVMQLSVIYDPMLDLLYFAKRGKGAFLNGKRIRCSAQKKWENSFGILSGNLGRASLIDRVARFLGQARKTPFWLSMFGSAGIAAGYIASGVRDWAVFGGGPWDCAAPALLLKEAGCMVTNDTGRSFKVGDTRIVAANKYIHPKILKLARSS